MDLVKSREVIEFATKAHEGQIRKGTGLPYWVHLEAVANLILQTDTHEDVYHASWLHDILEDTDVQYEELVDRFGKGVAILVQKCTDTPGLKGRERRSAKLAYIRTLYKPEPAREIMKADTLHNFTSSFNTLINVGPDGFNEFSAGIGIFRYYIDKMNTLALYPKQDHLYFLFGHVLDKLSATLTTEQFEKILNADIYVKQ